jgi:RNA polymerase sigma-70 factor (ECF subfamily)
MAFPETRWTLISHLSDPAKVDAALDQLCRVYWGPIYAYLLQSGKTHPEAQDLTQEFLEMVVRQRLLERANRESGKLRSWLLSALRNFLSNAHRYETRQKRGSGAYFFPLDSDDVIPELKRVVSKELSPDEAFDRAWVAVLLRRVLDLLAQQYRDAGRQREFDALLPWLVDTGDESQSDAATKAGLTPANFRVQLHRLRGRYRQILRQEVSATLEREEDYEQEVEYLFRISGQPV